MYQQHHQPSQFYQYSPFASQFQINPSIPRDWGQPQTPYSYPIAPPFALNPGAPLYNPTSDLHRMQSHQQENRQPPASQQTAHRRRPVIQTDLGLAPSSDSSPNTPQFFQPRSQRRDIQVKPDYAAGLSAALQVAHGLRNGGNRLPPVPVPVPAVHDIPGLLQPTSESYLASRLSAMLEPAQHERPPPLFTNEVAFHHEDRSLTRQVSQTERAHQRVESFRPQNSRPVSLFPVPEMTTTQADTRDEDLKEEAEAKSAAEETQQSSRVEERENGESNRDEAPAVIRERSGAVDELGIDSFPPRVVKKSEQEPKVQPSQHSEREQPSKEQPSQEQPAQESSHPKSSHPRSSHPRSSHLRSSHSRSRPELLRQRPHRPSQNPHHRRSRRTLSPNTQHPTQLQGVPKSKSSLPQEKHRLQLHGRNSMKAN
ncbi:hypothetical protein BT63DRAFT_176023 [Microthyrium microscopicum]|uniref:Uncharacterized protein n=1 Tax=Microthyrium microscopicum TaxID=703497 RepID=A0A6A6UH96_9PEZI|nr:hypothetical protein BT63DRAFT_176023 [Microthyrium microscopicum]